MLHNGILATFSLSLITNFTHDRGFCGITAADGKRSKLPLAADIQHSLR